MNALTPKYSARQDAETVRKRPQLVAGAIAARLPKVIAIPRNEPGSDFDRLMRAKLAEIEQATK